MDYLLQQRIYFFFVMTTNNQTPNTIQPSTIDWSDLARKKLFEEWLLKIQNKKNFTVQQMALASADASFRRYFRIQTDLGQSLIVMDAPPEKENNAQFVNVNEILAEELLGTSVFEQNLIAKVDAVLCSPNDKINFSSLNSFSSEKFFDTYHLGDDVLGLEWNTKMGSIGGEVLEGIQKSIALAEDKYKGLVIANEGPNFSAGANVGMIFMLAIEQEYDELDMAIRMFQNTMMRVRYSSVPVVTIARGCSPVAGDCRLRGARFCAVSGRV